jgi:hypothetical protein
MSRSRLKSLQTLPVEVPDELHWRIMAAFAVIQPLAPDRGLLAGLLETPRRQHGGGGARRLIEDMRQAASSRGQP